jgi:Ca-activated chloride channel family protein
LVVGLVVVLSGGLVLWLQSRPGGQTAEAAEARSTPGELQVINKEGEAVGVCPLEHTDVRAQISGFVARVEVTQRFHNPYQEKIEAVYTFPLSQNAAVDDMLMKVGERTIRGVIKEREEARRIYEAAKRAGHVASLLDQERPNIFTQSVANIMPGENVDVTIRYVEVLKFEDSWYEFSFPTVVGPRYIPGEPTSRVPEVAPENEGRVVQVPGPKSGPDPSGTGWAPDTNQVPDASRITPPVTAPGTRSGHDISISVEIDAGAPLRDLESKLHEVTTDRGGDTATVRLKNQKTIPNKDFILRYTTASDDIQDVVLTHSSVKGGFLTLVLQPPKRVRLDQVTPKEMVFVQDTSGSMMGEPIEKSKETMFHCLSNLNPEDTFNLITFSGDTRILFDKPVPATTDNIRKAQECLAAQQGSGGTEMMTAIRAALAPSDSQNHLRIVVFMTDGFVGNDMAIIDEVQKQPNARVFSFGIGQSPNRFLLDNMARAGRGEVDYVTLGTDGKQVAERFYERLRNPVLTDIQIDWGSLPVSEVYPERVLDLFSAKPVVVHARYDGPAGGEITLRGKVAGKPYERRIKVDLPARQPAHDVLGALWARANIEDLMNQDLLGAQTGQPRADIKETIIGLGLKFRLVTQYTSFVAVEEMVVTEGGQPRTIAVPVEMPEGVSYEGVFGEYADGRVMGKIARGAAYGGVAGASYAPGPAGPPVAMDALEERVEAPGVGAEPESRLAPELRGLAEKVAAQGVNGNLKVGSIEVKDGRVEVAVWVSDDSDASIEKMKELGFRVFAQAKAVRMLIGEIAVEKLEALSGLEFVQRVEPAPR